MNGAEVNWFAPDPAYQQASGMQWIPTKYANVNKLFWNQTLFEDSKKNPGFNFALFYGGTLTSVKFVDNLPAIFN